MRLLGMAAAVAVILAAVLNTIWFTRQGIGFGAFLSLSGPTVLGTTAFMAFTVLLGIVTMRMMLRRDAEDEEAARAEQAGQAGQAEQRRVAEGETEAE